MRTKYLQKLHNLGILLVIMSLASCNILKPSIMLRTGKNYPYEAAPTITQYEYKLAPNDLMSFRIFSNDGFKLIDLTNFNSNASAGRVELKYLIEHDGVIKLPIIGRTPIAGMTIREAELMLENTYAEYYKKPFVMLSVVNRRVMVFPGQEGSAKVIQLENNNTTLLEALAIAGGISTGKAKRIKLIRGDLKNPKVYLIDLSTIEGMKQADMVIQANDIIYVEPRLKVASTILAELTPVIGVFTSILLIISLLQPSN